MRKTRSGRLVTAAFLLLIGILAAVTLTCCTTEGTGTPVISDPQPTALERDPRHTDAPEPGEIRINEVMASNKATVADEEGFFPDWLELWNSGGRARTLEGWSIRCGHDSWELPVMTLGAGEYRVVFCDGKDFVRRGSMHSSFSISAAGEEIGLWSSDGQCMDRFPATAAQEDRSLWRDETGTFMAGPFATPGYENSEEGYAAMQKASSVRSGDLLISEAMASEETDWVEVLNPTDRTLNLGDYALSDKEKDRLFCLLPEREIAPGEVVLLSEELSFALNAGQDELYLSRKDGLLCDFCLLRDIPAGCSYGRDREKGFCYFEDPTPGAANARGVLFAGVRPALIGRDGLFGADEEVVTALSGPGTIRFTVDGSEPTASSFEYIGPMQVTTSCVIRAASFQEEHLRSEILNLSYFIGEEHRLPVVSLVCDDDAMFGEAGGVYNRPDLDLEIPGAVMFYDGDEGFRIDCGVKLHGATSKYVQQKKSLKLTFRNRYEGPLRCDLFGNGVTEFSSVLLRNAQEGRSSSYMRDALMHDCAIECFPELPAQDHRYAALYINGRYWGLYNLREAHSEEHFAAHYGVSAQTVTHWHEKWPDDSPAEEIFQYAMSHDLSDPEAYAHVAAHLNTDSVIAWLILQYYSGNFDFNAPNMRFYWAEDRLWYALVDLDLSLFQYGSLPALTDRGYYAYNRLAGALMENDGFREAFCRRFHKALCGPLSDEKMLERIDRFAGEIRPEIRQEKTRWGGSTADWEKLVQSIRDRITYGKGYAATVVRNLVSTKAIHNAEAKEYFPNFIS